MLNNLKVVKQFVKKMVCKNYYCYVIFMNIFILLYILFGHAIMTFVLMTKGLITHVILLPTACVFDTCMSLCRFYNKELIDKEEFQNV